MCFTPDTEAFTDVSTFLVRLLSIPKSFKGDAKKSNPDDPIFVAATDASMILSLVVMELT